LVAKGYRVYGTVRTQTPEAALPGLRLVTMDVRNGDSIRAAVRKVVDAEGRIDALVNNAGVALTGSIEETALEEAQALFDTNFFGVARVTQEVLPHMRGRKSGRIVNIGSVVGFLPAPFMGYYSASKHALEGYTESLDHEVRPLGIRAIVIEPAFMRTHIGGNSLAARSKIADYAQDAARVGQAVQAAIDRGSDPERVAEAVLAALHAPNPPRRIPVGKDGRLLSVLRRFAPSSVLDKGLRKQFGLE
jgi:NAD(P)-dependent dehydrogenase (short-subunit alcohol dehydrogenase family)